MRSGPTGLHRTAKPVKVLALLVSMFIGGCSTLNIFRGPDDFCRQMSSGYSSSLEAAVARESRKEPPNGALTQPYSRAQWDKYWNSRIYHMWDIGPESCNGTYEGPAGPALIQNALDTRRERGLPEVNLEPRNEDKDLQP